MEIKLKSKCCCAPVIVEGIPDFIGDEDVCTVNYRCKLCGKPCSLLDSERCTRCGAKCKDRIADYHSDQAILEAQRLVNKGIVKLNEGKCIYKLELLDDDPDYSNVYSMSCCEEWLYLDSTFKYCPYCGKPIEIIEVIEDK
jgi:hypothetical protein